MCFEENKKLFKMSSKEFWRETKLVMCVEKKQENKKYIKRRFRAIRTSSFLKMLLLPKKKGKSGDFEGKDTVSMLKRGFINSVESVSESGSTASPRLNFFEHCGRGDSEPIPK